MMLLDQSSSYFEHDSMELSGSLFGENTEWSHESQSLKPGGSGSRDCGLSSVFGKGLR
jgi:hypothetical protein